MALMLHGSALAPATPAATPAVFTPDPTWYVAVTRWLDSQRSDNTRDAYARDFDHYRLWLMAELPHIAANPLAATRSDLAAYATAVARLSGIKPATKARRLAAVSSFYAYAVDLEYIDSNPAARIKRPAVSTESPRMGLTGDEARRIIEASDRHTAQHRALLALCLGCGLRVSEALAVTPADITVVKGHRVLTVTGKGGKVRTVPISPQAFRLLSDALDACPDPSRRIIEMSEAGQPIDRQRALRMVETLGRHAGVEHRLRPHDLRHTAATLALDAGAPIHRVQDLLGHSSPITTQRYVQHRERLDNSAAYVLGTVLAGGIA